jgi:transmembrane sensor
MVAPRNIVDIRAEQAVRAWTQRHSGTWTAADETNLQAWLAADPEHRAAFEKVGRAWTAAGEIGGRLPRDAATARPHQRHRIWAAVAATLAAVLVYPIWVTCDNWWNGAPAEWAAKRGETRSIHLIDGTRVVLDADSEIETRIGARARHIVLRRGEALLTVAHDATRPFKVDTGAGQITDLGTQFDIENLRGLINVCVLEGRVGISTPRGKVILEAGRAGGYDGAGMLLPVRNADGNVTLWQNGQRHFDADRLSDVLERLTRYHVVTFVFTDPQLQELRVSGTFRTDNLPLFLRTLRAALPIETVWLSAQRVEISRRTGIGSRESFAANLQ